jgi:hypothetical protein
LGRHEQRGRRRRRRRGSKRGQRRTHSWRRKRRRRLFFPFSVRLAFPFPSVSLPSRWVHALYIIRIE